MPANEANTPVSASPAFDFEAEKLAIEREKLLLEREKLSVERYKARLGAFGIAIPLCAVAATVGLGMWTQYEKGRDDFTLKSADVLLQSDSPIAAKNKALALQSLFPKQLPGDFAKTFDPAKFGSNIAGSQRELLRLMVAKPERAMETLALWKAVFPGDSVWIDPLKERLAADTTLRREVSGGQRHLHQSVGGLPAWRKVRHTCQPTDRCRTIRRRDGY